ncbi:hypothetical protein BAX94_02195 [Elizabethkingia meningoseptica]|uniref:Lipopolysaccharide biosynthesis protein n=1 Tax=Elizabethkingia meningoseptica TaxID=238 RepID=A0A1T3FHT4_ELIME|nr:MULTISPECIES: MOP flippase family protein [Elizabethkingia]AQX12436.1 hypothetical protein BBD35_08665 [Elizabethkingia meningoseptica]MBG0513974.1 MOP flippase family protein [Elizabethkingia meningoseptica]MDE5432889.1 MOP flippase family protein [Elizabethkingia meningoseptica]MDE5448029.1 MOP flippase family protein [Elizabethkingia meningoseptica]MDE5471680.1 MOP flippase family protein [Elizabethkingia meningoseptica]
MFNKAVAKGMKWTTYSSIVTTICSLISISILTRFVEKGDFGLIAIVVFSLSFFDLFNDMGISVAILHKQDMIQKEYSSLYWFNLLISFVLYAVVILVTPLISDFYNFPKLNYLIPLVGLSLLMNGIGKQFKIILEKDLFFKSISVIEISTAIVALITSSICAIKGMGVYALVINSLTSAFLGNILFLLIGIHLKHRITLFCRFYYIKPFLRIGLYQMGGQIANYFNRDFDILIIGKAFGPEVLGIYSLSKQLVNRPFQILNPIIIKVASPMLAKLQKSSVDLKTNYLNIINLIGGLNMIVYSILFITAPIVIKILYGNNFGEANWIVRILCFYMVLRSMGNAVGSLTIATGKTYLEFYWNVVLLIVIPFGIYLGSLGNIYTICIALVIITILTYYPFWKFLINKMIDVSFSEYLKACFVPKFTSIVKTLR